MNQFKYTLLAGVAAVALLAVPVAMADVAGTSVTQTATHLDAATIWQGEANGATSCNAVSQTSASDTITITPPGGQYVYLTALVLQKSTDATGVTEVPTVSMTNIAGGGFPAFLSLASTLSTTSGAYLDQTINFGPGGLKSAQPGVAVTFVPSAAASAHSIFCNSATYYTNAN
jgi:hypothetical protein